MSSKNKRNVKKRSRALEKTKSSKRKSSYISFTFSMKLGLAITAVIFIIILGLYFGGNITSAQSGQPDRSQSTVSASGNENNGNSALGNAKIFFPDTSFDFGTVGQNMSVSHTFIVKNIGDMPLKLIKAKGS